MKSKILKVLTATLLGSVLSTGVLLAQDGPPPRGEGRGPGMQTVVERLKHLADELQLTDAQKEQLKPILEAEIKAMKELRDNKELDRDAKREKMQALRKDFQAKIKAVLTKEQAEKLEKIQAERGPGGPGGKKDKKEVKE